jgi:hypothetical protein
LDARSAVKLSHLTILGLFNSRPTAVFDGGNAAIKEKLTGLHRVRGAPSTEN